MKIPPTNYEIGDLVIIKDEKFQILERMLTISTIRIDINPGNNELITIWYGFKETMYMYAERSILKKIEIK